jgi:hypothetical protein
MLPAAGWADPVVEGDCPKPPNKDPGRAVLLGEASLGRCANGLTLGAVWLKSPLAELGGALLPKIEPPEPVDALLPKGLSPEPFAGFVVLLAEELVLNGVL